MLIKIMLTFGDANVQSINERRWQERLVINMIRLVYYPVEEVWIMTEVDIFHNRLDMKIFHKLCGE
jgi:hypothetical protein